MLVCHLAESHCIGRLLPTVYILVDDFHSHFLIRAVGDRRWVTSEFGFLEAYSLHVKYAFSLYLMWWMGRKVPAPLIFFFDWAIRWGTLIQSSYIMEFWIGSPMRKTALLPIHPLEETVNEWLGDELLKILFSEGVHWHVEIISLGEGRFVAKSFVTQAVALVYGGCV